MGHELAVDHLGISELQRRQPDALIGHRVRNHLRRYRGHRRSPSADSPCNASCGVSKLLRSMKFQRPRTQTSQAWYVILLSASGMFVGYWSLNRTSAHPIGSLSSVRTSLPQRSHFAFISIDILILLGLVRQGSTLRRGITPAFRPSLRTSLRTS